MVIYSPEGLEQEDWVGLKKPALTCRFRDSRCRAFQKEMARWADSQPSEPHPTGRGTAGGEPRRTLEVQSPEVGSWLPLSRLVPDLGKLDCNFPKAQSFLHNICYFLSRFVYSQFHALANLQASTTCFTSPTQTWNAIAWHIHFRKNILSIQNILFLVSSTEDLGVEPFCFYLCFLLLPRRNELSSDDQEKELRGCVYEIVIHVCPYTITCRDIIKVQ